MQMTRRVTLVKTPLPLKNLATRPRMKRRKMKVYRMKRMKARFLDDKFLTQLTRIDRYFEQGLFRQVFGAFSSFD